MQTEVQAAIDELVGSGAETGLQVAVFHEGHLVVDAVAGTADPETGAPVSADTLFFAASTAKGVTSSLAHVLAERGELDYDMRLADVWPEFGQHGKGELTVRHVLMHTAGVPGLPVDTTVEQFCDRDYMCSVLAEATPWWQPGTRFGYHARTFGFLLGETMRRATGHPISTLLRDLIAGPLGVADEILFEVPQHLLPRVARQVDAGPKPPPPAPGSPQERAMPRALIPDARFANRRDVLTSNLPSEGTMTARGVARMYSALLGYVEGVELVSPQRLARMAAIVFTGMDEVMGFATTWAFGYSPYRPGVPFEPDSTFGMVGMNGSAAYADTDSGVAVALMRNRFAAGDMAAAERVGRIVTENLS